MFETRSSSILKAYLLLSVVLAFASCSFSIPFLLTNKTDSEITVIYTLKKTYGKQMVPTLQGSFGEDLPFPPDRIKIDFEDDSIEVTLKAGETMLIDRPNDRVIERPDEFFNLSSLRIIGKSSMVSLEGNEVFERFRPIRRSALSYGPKYKHYALEYSE